MTGDTVKMKILSENIVLNASLFDAPHSLAKLFDVQKHTQGS